MTQSQRLRAPLLFLAGSAIPLVVGGAKYGWSSLATVGPIIIVVAVVLFVLSGRDSDVGAVVRGRADERQSDQKLHVQAFVGRILSLAVAVAYLVAVATKSQLWPYGALVGVMAVALITGWLMYGERGLRHR